jgi:hypothetical protein
MGGEREKEEEEGKIRKKNMHLTHDHFRWICFQNKIKKRKREEKKLKKMSNIENHFQ